MTNGNDNINKIKTADEYFEQNAKFFGSGDINGKKAFFALGQYTKKVMDCKEAAPDEKFQKKLNQLIMGSMTYRVFGAMLKLLDDMALKCDPKIFYSCSGVPKQFMINAELPGNRKALDPADASLAFSLGLCQKF
jgi:hypothetical protein